MLNSTPRAMTPDEVFAATLEYLARELGVPPEALPDHRGEADDDDAKAVGAGR
jgi:hypothetical protein